MLLSTYLFVSLILLIGHGDTAHRHRRNHLENSRENDWTTNGHRSYEFTYDDETTRSSTNAIEVNKGNAKSLLTEENRGSIPFSSRRLEKMLEKAILKIITGELSTADMLLLKSLNYSLEEVLAIRERELGKKKDEAEELTRRKKDEDDKLSRKVHHGEGRRKDRHWKSSKETNHAGRGKQRSEEMSRERKRERSTEASTSRDRDFDYEAYNRQAVLDYENLASQVDSKKQSWSEPVSSLDYEDHVDTKEPENSSEEFRRNFDKAMEPHVVFKIRYDDSEFDSSSSVLDSGEDKLRSANRNRNSPRGSKYHRSTTLRHGTTTARSTASSFHEPSSTTVPTILPSLPIVYNLSRDKSQEQLESKEKLKNTQTTVGSLQTNSLTTTSSEVPIANSTEKEPPKNDETFRKMLENETADDKSKKKVSEYEGLEWVEDDVYRVIPALADSLSYENNEDNETSDYESESDDFYRQGLFAVEGDNDTAEYQNDESINRLTTLGANASDGSMSMNLSAYQQLALAHRREGNLTSNFDSQGQKAIEEIKSRVLALTGRFNLSTNTNQVQRERLTMFHPTCQIPRNTDPETWLEPFSMNMHFQLNLTAGDHVVAAKLRLFKLPQENFTISTVGGFEDDEEEEKIRISVYYYTKSLKKHRSKKRLMDSVVTPLNSEGNHLALDVRQGLRFWRSNSRNAHGNGSNHGLVVQVEDQDGRPLKPSLYIQQPSCVTPSDSDEKAYQRGPALFVRACTRYVRVVNGKTVTYVNCRH